MAHAHARTKTYFIESFDEARGESSEDCAGEQLQEEAVEPHVDREQGLIDDLSNIYRSSSPPDL